MCANERRFASYASARRQLRSVSGGALRRNQLGVSFRRQHGIGPFIVDFCCLASRLVIEVDGDVHERDDVRDQDGWRSDYLRSSGFAVVRFTNDDVMTRLHVVLDDIRLALHQATGR